MHAVCSARIAVSAVPPNCRSLIEKLASELLLNVFFKYKCGIESV
jgi:hypothetical protein